MFASLLIHVHCISESWLACLWWWSILLDRWALIAKCMLYINAPVNVHPTVPPTGRPWGFWYLTIHPVKLMTLDCIFLSESPTSWSGDLYILNVRTSPGSVPLLIPWKGYQTAIRIPMVVNGGGGVHNDWCVTHSWGLGYDEMLTWNIYRVEKLARNLVENGNLDSIRNYLNDMDWNHKFPGYLIFTMYTLRIKRGSTIWDLWLDEGGTGEGKVCRCN